MAAVSWQLREYVRPDVPFADVVAEADAFVATRIKPSLAAFESRMRKHESSRIRRILLGCGPVLVDVAKMFLAVGAQDCLISLGKSLVEAASAIDAVKRPEEQVVSYLYHLEWKISDR